MAALYARRYAPYEWKRQLFGFDLLDIGPWLDRVARSADDLEFFEIALEYIASLDDTHSSFSMPSNFIASLGFAVDIYDDRVLIEAINRTRLPVQQYPFQIGDELISVDGRPVEELMADFSRFLKRANPRSTRRTMADFLTFRPQSRLPRTIDLPDQAIVVIAREGGGQESFSIPWLKTGRPLRFIGPVTSPSTSSLFALPGDEQDLPSYYDPWLELTNFRLPDNDPLLSGDTVSPPATWSRVDTCWAWGSAHRCFSPACQPTSCSGWGARRLTSTSRGPTRPTACASATSDYRTSRRPPVRCWSCKPKSRFSSRTPTDWSWTSCGTPAVAATC